MDINAWTLAAKARVREEFLTLCPYQMGGFDRVKDIKIIDDMSAIRERFLKQMIQAVDEAVKVHGELVGIFGSMDVWFDATLKNHLVGAKRAYIRNGFKIPGFEYQVNPVVS